MSEQTATSSTAVPEDTKVVESQSLASSKISSCNQTKCSSTLDMTDSFVFVDMEQENNVINMEKTNVDKNVYSTATTQEATTSEAILQVSKLMAEYVQLKNTLQQVNIAMRQFMHKTQQLQTNLLNQQQHYRQQLRSSQQQIVVLRIENLKLQQLIMTKNTKSSNNDERKKTDLELQQIMEMQAFSNAD